MSQVTILYNGQYLMLLYVMILQGVQQNCSRLFFLISRLPVHLGFKVGHFVRPLDL